MFERPLQQPRLHLVHGHKGITVIYTFNHFSLDLSCRNVSPRARPPSDGAAQTFDANDGYAFLLGPLVDEGFKVINLCLRCCDCSEPLSWMLFPPSCQKL
jgi:hypothetical protein